MVLSKIVSKFRGLKGARKLLLYGGTTLTLGVGTYAAYFLFKPQAAFHQRIQKAQKENRKPDLERVASLPKRSDQLRSLQNENFDVIVIGGGISGAGVALDAVTRGFKTALVERDDFSSGTSSRSTKLIHGGVRYLEKAILRFDRDQYKMVKEALRERGHLLQIAPHLSYPLPIMLPVYSWWHFVKYWAGLQLYDWVAGNQCVIRCYGMSKARALEEFPMLKKKDLKGAMVYYDGGHNDARMNTSVVITAARYGATMANHAEVKELVKADNGAIEGVVVQDRETGDIITVKGKCVVNATGAFTDSIRQMDDKNESPICVPAKGVHITLPGYYSPASMGLLDPQTSDGRVIFFLPWEGTTIAGTTDDPCEITESPAPLEKDIVFILREVEKYIADDVHVRRGDVMSAWAGIRPLVKDPSKTDTQSVARNHIIDVSKNNLVTLAGGKWTTYRHMAEETVDEIIKRFNLKPKRECQTLGLILEGSYKWTPNAHIHIAQDFGLDDDVARHLSHTYGDKAYKIARLAKLTGRRSPVVGIRLHPMFPYIEAEVYYAMHEYATSAVDVLFRRTRLAFVNAEAAMEALPKVIDIMADHLKWSQTKQKEEYDKCVRLLELEMGLHLARVKSKISQDDAITNLTTDDLKEYTKRFESLDKERKGYITINDLRGHMNRAGTPIKEETLHEMLDEVDCSMNGQIEMDEYLQLMSAMKSGRIASSRFAAATQLDTQIKSIQIDRSGGGI